MRGQVIASPDEALARANNDNLCGFFGALKDHDAQVKIKAYKALQQIKDKQYEDKQA